MMIRTPWLGRAGLVSLAALVSSPIVPTAAQQSVAARIVHTNPSAYRQLHAVHAGAGSMAFTMLLGRGAIGPYFNFFHRGEIPAGSGIGHHFHNAVEEMFVILDGEAQFTIDGRTALLKGPVGVVCRMGHSHAILNTSQQTIQWMNFQATSIPGVSDNFDLGDDRVGAAVDPIPTFMTMKLDRASLTQAAARGRGFGRGRGAPPADTGVLTDRGFGPAVFASAWAYVDHVLVSPGASTTPNAHELAGEAYYVLAGSGSVTIGADSAPVGKWDAIPVKPGETSAFHNTGSEPLELLVVGVAKDMDAKREILTGGRRPR
jgi:mannose-6-phosphate isomerase-like protein (cupin superfamily)